MKYAMLIHYKPGHTDALSEEEFKAMLAEYIALRDDPAVHRQRGSCSRSRRPRRCACRTGGR